MLLPMSPTSSLFLLAETREHPMHVGGLQLFQPPEGADALDVRAMFDAEVGRGEVAPLSEWDTVELYEGVELGSFGPHPSPWTHPTKASRLALKKERSSSALSSAERR